MEMHEVILGLAACAIAGVDIFVRLRHAPQKRDPFVGEMLNAISEGDTAGDVVDVRYTAVANSLIEHFDNSYVSRTIVRTLAEVPRGMTQKELELQFATIANETGKPALRACVLRKVIIILMQAGFVAVREGRIRITSLGEELNAMLQSRRVA